MNPHMIANIEENCLKCEISSLTETVSELYLAEQNLLFQKKVIQRLTDTLKFLKRNPSISPNTPQWRNAFHMVIYQLNGQYGETQYMLRERYRQSPLPSRYWRILSIGYMNELLQMGICGRLGGEEGLCRTVDRELTDKQMAAETDDVVNRFHQLVDDEMILYDGLSNRLEEADAMADDTASFLFENISRDTPQREFANILAASLVGAYLTERQAKEQEYLASLIFQ